MPPDAKDPVSPHPHAPSFGDKVRNFMLGIGSLGLELASFGAQPSHYVDDGGHEPGESRRAKTWYGRILQWTWAILVLLFGIVMILLAIVIGVDWVMSWFD